jgi:hypothetical protein
MKRYALSRPLALAMSHCIISPSRKVLDYGCGRGTDIRLLQKAGIPASGWDPHFRPDDPLQPTDCVNLDYVLNVIEDPAERAATLHNAFQLAEKVLIVSDRSNYLWRSSGLLRRSGLLARTCDAALASTAFGVAALACDRRRRVCRHSEEHNEPDKRSRKHFRSSN